MTFATRLEAFTPSRSSGTHLKIRSRIYGAMRPSRMIPVKHTPATPACFVDREPVRRWGRMPEVTPMRSLLPPRCDTTFTSLAVA